MTNIKIGRAKECKAKAPCHLIKEFAQTQKAPPPNERTNFPLQLDALQSKLPLDIWVAEIDGNLASGAATYYSYSTFKNIHSTLGIFYI